MAAAQDGGKSEVSVNSSPALKPKDWVLLSLRFVAFFATAAATIVMALNKQTNTLVVATVGNTPVKAAVTAKFQQTPAFVLVFVPTLLYLFYS